MKTSNVLKRETVVSAKVMQNVASATIAAETRPGPNVRHPDPNPRPRNLLIIMRRPILALVVWLGLATGCRFAPNEVQSYRHIDPQGWYVDSLVQIECPVSDTLSLYDMQVGLRYTDDYDYANLWLFITTVSPDGTQHLDTLNATLCDAYGRWMGSGVGVQMQQEIPFKTLVRFGQPGVWRVVIQQGMRDSCLPGITAVGLKISAR